MRINAGMAGIAESLRLVDSIVRLRRAERVGKVARDIAPVRRDLEAQLGPTLSRSRAARILGVSQTALDRWVAAGQIPTVLTPSGRREVPRQFVVELRESIDGLMRKAYIDICWPPPSPSAATRRKRWGKAGRFGTAAARPGSRHRGASQSCLPRGCCRPPRRVDARSGSGEVEWLVAEGHLRPDYADHWRELLARPATEVASAITADTEDARTCARTARSPAC
jgi:hypothetical protein